MQPTMTPATNPTTTFGIPAVPLTLDRERHLMYDFNALALIEEQTKQSFLIRSEPKAPSMKDLRVMIWAGLIREDPTLSLKQVGKIIPMNRLAECSQAINTAFSNGLAQVKPGTLPNVPSPSTVVLEATATSESQN